MNLLKACQIADACGLHTIGEALMNVKIHALSLFAYDEAEYELKELLSEAKDYDKEAMIADVLPKLLVNSISSVEDDDQPIFSRDAGTYEYLMDMAKATSDSFPFVAKNGCGETVVVEHGNDENGNFIRVRTFQDNGWIRVNTYYEGETADGTQSD